MTTFPYKIVKVKDDDDTRVRSVFTSIRSGLIRIGEKGWIMQDCFRNHAANIYNMKVRADDIWLITYPKSGTTMTQELVWLLMNNFDYKISKEKPLFERSRFIEHTAYYHDDVISETAGEYPENRELIEEMYTPKYTLAEQDPSPRTIKTHIPFSLLPPGLENRCKVIYVARNAKDVCVSYFHHNSSSKAFGYSGTFPEYVDFFIKDLVLSGPYWEHVKEGWERRNHPNVLFLFYEDLIKDLESTVKKIANFLGKEVSDNDIKTLANHLQIDNFRKNVLIRDEREMKAFTYVNPKKSTVSQFIRQGGIGKNKELTDDLNKILDEWIEKNQQGLNIPFQMK